MHKPAMKAKEQGLNDFSVPIFLPLSLSAQPSGRTKAA
jgi:hypothetical protein